jgi:hypothetical protein
MTLHDRKVKILRTLKKLAQSQNLWDLGFRT